MRAGMRTAFFTLLGLLFSAHLALAVRPNDFKKCSDSSLCRRLRRLSTYSDEHSTPDKQFRSPYSLHRRGDADEVTFDSATSTLRSPVLSALHPDIEFALEVRFHADGTARVRMDEVGNRYGGWKRYDEAEKWAIESQPVPAPAEQVSWKVADGVTTVIYGPEKAHKLELVHSPLKLSFLRNEVSQIVLNERGLFHMEHYRARPDPFPSPKGEGEEQAAEGLVFQDQGRAQAFLGKEDAAAWAGFEEQDSGEWEESWSGKPDSKPKGPEGLSLDITFPGYEHVFGIPEHASPLSLRSTRGERDGDFTDPYRLMNTDVFEYDYDSPMALYGSVPLMHAQAPGSSVAIFWLSGSETWIDIQKRPSKLSPTPKMGEGGSSGVDTHTHWMSESGILDLFIYLGPTAEKNLELFTGMVGRTALPQLFAIGYHQCRWNYLTTDDVLNVDAKFDEEDIPMDVMWLDIEYSKDHMYGVWDEVAFNNPERMLDGLDAKGRKLVIIIDPHLKRTRDYWLYAEAQDLDILVKTPDGKGEYEGWCWSGSASWLDMFHPKSWEWWTNQYSLASKKLKANARNLFVWNDMSEPAIFNGPEVTSPKDVKHYGGWEHRDLHNINGLLFQNNTARGLIERESPARRPFVLSRAWWVGTQKYGAIWTGDNLGTWEHLAVSVPMILANGIAGMSFCGADIGGFFGNPSSEMLVRWYQAGIFEPFFRAHAHIDTKRREPYLLEEPYKSVVRDLIRLRYKMLPAWYTAFREAGVSGLPILRPQYLVFPYDANGFAIDDQYYIGDTGLLVKPAVKEEATSVDIYLAEDQPYYNYFTHDIYYGSASGRSVNVPAPLSSQLPLLHRGGSILPLRERVRRSAELGWRDPITLVVALNKPTKSSIGGSAHTRAEGILYLDDGQTFEYEKGAFVWRRFIFETRTDGSHALSSFDETARRGKAATGSSTGWSTTSEDSVALYDPTNNSWAQQISDVRVERVVVLGLDKAPKSVRVKGTEEELVWEWTSGTSAAGSKVAFGGKAGRASELVIKDPRVKVTLDWEIDFV